jgi:hypothetical protein
VRAKSVAYACQFVDDVGVVTDVESCSLPQLGDDETALGPTGTLAARNRRNQAVDGEVLTELADVEPQRPAAGFGRFAVPCLVEQFVGIDHAAGLEGEQCQQRLLDRGARDMDVAVIVDHVDGPQQTNNRQTHPHPSAIEHGPQYDGRSGVEFSWPVRRRGERGRPSGDEVRVSARRVRRG